MMHKLPTAIAACLALAVLPALAAPPQLTVSAPVDGLLTTGNSVAVSGEVDDAAANVRVNGTTIPVTVTGAFGPFDQDLPAADGVSTVTIVATNAAGETATVVRTITRDATAPVVRVTSPADGAVFGASGIRIAGSVDDVGATITASINGDATVLHPVLNPANGSFVIPTCPLQEGSNTVVLGATDDAGNAATPVQLVLVLDPTAPAAPVLTNPPSRTADRQLVLSGTAEAESTVQVSGALTPGTAVTAATGEFQISAIQLAENQENVLSITATDAAGNVSTPLVQTIYCDTAAPVISVSCPAANANLTEDQVLVCGRVADASATTLAIGEDAVAVAADGTFHTVLSLANGTNDLVFHATDALGHEATVTVTVTVDDDGADTEAPVVAFVSPQPDTPVAAAEVGVVVCIADADLPNVTVDVNGTGYTAADFPGGTLACNATLGTNGTITVTAADSGGRSTTRVLQLVLDETPPAAPEVLQPADGTLRTNDDAIVAIGTAEAGCAVAVTGGALASVETVADANGRFSLRVPLTPNQANVLCFTAKDLAGNSSTPPTECTVTHDNQPPRVVTIVPADAAVDIAPDATIAVTFSKAMQTENPAGHVTLLGAGGSIPVSASFDGTGTVLTISHATRAFHSEEILKLTLDAQFVDLAGNCLATTISTFMTADTEAPAPPVFPAYPTIVNSQPVLLQGTAEPNADIALVDSAVTARAAADGTFSIAAPLAENGGNTLLFTATDADGNPSDPATVTITHDNVAPELDSVAPADGSDDLAANASFTIVASEPLAAAGLSDIVLTCDGTVVATTVSLDGSTVTVKPDSPLPQDGSELSLLIPTSVTDVAGNAVAETTYTFTLTDIVDPIAPSGLSCDPSSPTKLTVVNVTGCAEPGSTISISGGATVASGPADGGTFTIPVTLNENASNTLTVKSTDDAGNESPVATLVVVHDLTPPEVDEAATIPGDGDTLAANDVIFIEFTEPVKAAVADPAQEQVYVVKAGDGDTHVTGKFSLSSSGKCLTFMPIPQLLPNTQYSLCVQTSVEDLAGNFLATTFILDFGTSKAVLDKPVAPVFDPAPPPTTGTATITLHLKAESGTTLHLLGGVAEDTAATDTDGVFTIENYQLRPGVNQLVAYSERTEDTETVVGQVGTATITYLADAPGVDILTPTTGTTYHNRSITVAGRIDHPDLIESITVSASPEAVTGNNGAAAIIGNCFAKQLVFAEVLPGTTQTVTVSVAVAYKDGTTPPAPETCTFVLAPYDADNDSTPPILTILFPAPNEVLTSRFVEVMGTVEEGGKVGSVSIDNVPYNGMIGNIFLCYAELSQQGANTITVEATDAAGNLGTATVDVLLDDQVPEAPDLDPHSGYTTERVLVVTGTAEAGIEVRISGGLVDVSGTADGGTFSIPVPLHPNSVSRLVAVAVDAAGNQSLPDILSVTHDDTRPTLVSSYPEANETGVPIECHPKLVFSEPLAATTIAAGITVAGSAGAIPVDCILSTDGCTVTIVPRAKFERNDTVTITVNDSLADEHAYFFEGEATVSFATAVYKTIMTGVVLDPAMKPLADVVVGIKGTEISATTSSYGTFLLDQLPAGPQILTVNGRKHHETTADNRLFPYLEFGVDVVVGADNSLGRPIFLVPDDLSTITATVAEGATIEFGTAGSDLEGLRLTYQSQAPRLVDGSLRPNVTATFIPAECIPGRLPANKIPYFTVRLGPDDLLFDPPASVVLPNPYGLKEGEEVDVYHYLYGTHELAADDGNGDAVGLTTVTVGAGDTITLAGLVGGGYIAYVPKNDKHADGTQLRGKVVDATGSPIRNVHVSALGGADGAITNEDGSYAIYLPNVRLYDICTYASIPTTLDPNDSDAQTVVFKSEPVEVELSGITDVPTIVVDAFVLTGNVRHVMADGTKLPCNGDGAAYADGIVTSIGLDTSKNVVIQVYTRRSDGVDPWSDTPYAVATPGGSTDAEGYDTEYSIPFIASADTAAAAAIPKPGDRLLVVARDPATGYYGQTEVVLPGLGDNTAPVTLAVAADIDLHPPVVQILANRVFYVDAERRRADLANHGLVLTSDEFVEIRTTWRTRFHTPLDRAGISLAGRFQVEADTTRTDHYFDIRGGEHPHVVEIREAMYPERLSVLGLANEVGTETLTVSPDGSFNALRNVPLEIRNRYDDPATQPSVQALTLQVVQASIVERTDDPSLLTVQAAPKATVTLTGPDGFATITGTTDDDGLFSAELDSVPDGLELSVNGSPATPIGPSHGPELESLSPDTGSQGDVITLVGKHFSPVPSQNTVRINGTVAPVGTDATETQLTITVPDTASSGLVTVEVAGKTSNGLPFTFVSNGVNNGSFERGTLHGFSTTGSVSVVKGLRNIRPLQGDWMAYLNTANDPRDGTATITTDPFYVPEGVTHLGFEFHFMGTALKQTLADYMSAELIVGNEATEVAGVFPTANVLFVVEGNTSGYEVGVEFMSALVDLAAHAGSDVPVQVRFTLRGRGEPPRGDGLRDDDDNPLDLTKTPGTGLLLDHLRLVTGPSLPVPPDLSGVALAYPDDGFAQVSGPPNAALEDATVFLRNIQNGRQYEVQAANDGSFSATVQRFSEVQTHYAVSCRSAAGGDEQATFVSGAASLALPSAE